MARYELTRPIYKNGGTAFYWDILKKAQSHITYKRAEIDRMERYMTFQALVEANLLENIDGYYELTATGQDYIKYYESNHDPKVSFFEYTSDETTSNINLMDSELDSLDDIQDKEVEGPYKVEVLPMSGISFELYFDDIDIAEVTKLTINKSTNAVAY